MTEIKSLISRKDFIEKKQFNYWKRDKFDAIFAFFTWEVLIAVSVDAIIAGGVLSMQFDNVGFLIVFTLTGFIALVTCINELVKVQKRLESLRAYGRKRLW